MRLISTLAIAGLLSSTAAFAAATATTPTAAPPAAKPAAAAPMARHASAKHCRAEATTKKLAGKEREQYIKDCEAGKAAS